MKHIKLPVFIPPFLILILSAVYSFSNPESFLSQTTKINTWILDTFGPLFSVAALCFLIICVVAYISPLGRKRIGGPEAQPLFSRWKWFSVTLCTTIATGILFWGTAEPLYHLHGPPTGMGIEANSPEAITFSMSTMYMHWSFIPYGIYTIASLMFALMYYNQQQPFSLGAMLYPILGHRAQGKLGNIIDAICLYTLVAGMAASLGTGILMLTGGMDRIMGIPYGKFTMGIVASLIVITFIVSAASGLMKGIRILSDLNVKIFIGLAVFVFIFGPTTTILSVGWEGIQEFIIHFFDRSLIGVAGGDHTWAKSWTIFYWANWLAWTPISAMFLGRIAKGYTVREFIHFNLIFPSLFACAWMMIFSGSSLGLDIATEATPMYDVLKEEGGSSKVIFALLEALPLTTIMSIMFLAVAFISFVTAADSNTSVMGGISTNILHNEDGATSPLSIKIIWGSLIGVVAYVMVAFSDNGIEGIKMLSNLGGLPALFLVILIAIGMIKTIIQHDKING